MQAASQCGCYTLIRTFTVYVSFALSLHLWPNVKIWGPIKVFLDNAANLTWLRTWFYYNGNNAIQIRPIYMDFL